MRVALIGHGAIGRWIYEKLDPKPLIVERTDALRDVDLVVEAAGHGALMQHGVAALEQGGDLIIASTGALADASLWTRFARPHTSQCRLRDNRYPAIQKAQA